MTQFEQYWLITDQGEVEGRLFKRADAGASPKGPAVLMAHGKRELIDDSLDRVWGEPVE